MEKVEITFALKGREFFEGLMISSLRRIFTRIGLVFFALLILIAVITLIRVSAEAWSLLLYAIVLSVIFLATLVGVPAFRSLQYSRNKLMSAPVTWRINRDRIEIQSERGESKIAWKSFERPTETWNLFFLYSAADKRSIYILPKRAFRDDTQRERFREIARNACGKIF